MPKKTLEEKKLRIMEYAFWAGKLMELEPSKFDKLSKAIAKKNKKDFLKIAAEAGVPKNVLKNLEDDTEYVNALKAEDGWGGGWGGWGGGWG